MARNYWLTRRSERQAINIYGFKTPEKHALKTVAWGAGWFGSGRTYKISPRSGRRTSMSWLDQFQRDIEAGRAAGAQQAEAAQKDFEAHVSEVFRQLQHHCGFPPKNVKYVDLDLGQSNPLTLDKARPSFKAISGSQVAAVELLMPGSPELPIWIGVGFRRTDRGMTAAFGGREFQVPSDTGELLHHIQEAVSSRLRSGSLIGPVKVGL